MTVITSDSSLVCPFPKVQMSQNYVISSGSQKTNFPSLSPLIRHRSVDPNALKILDMTRLSGQSILIPKQGTDSGSSSSSASVTSNLTISDLSPRLSHWKKNRVPEIVVETNSLLNSSDEDEFAEVQSTKSE